MWCICCRWNKFTWERLLYIFSTHGVSRFPFSILFFFFFIRCNSFSSYFRSQSSDHSIFDWHLYSMCWSVSFGHILLSNFIDLDFGFLRKNMFVNFTTDMCNFSNNLLLSTKHRRLIKYSFLYITFMSYALSLLNDPCHSLH